MSLLMMARRGAVVSGGGGSFTPNKPAGLTTLVDITFDGTFDNAAPEPPETYVLYNYKGAVVNKFDNGRASVQPSLSESGGHVLQSKAPVGFGAGNTMQIGPQGITLGNNYRHVYWAFTMNVALDNVLDSNGQKLIYPGLRVDGNDGRPKPGIAFNDSGPDPDRITFNGFQFYWWDGSAFTWIIPQQNADSRSFAKGAWHRIECEMKMETLGATDSALDGILRMWVSTWNGSSYDAPVKIMERTTMLIGEFGATTSKMFESMSLDLYRGGAGIPTVVTDAKIYFSRCHWSAA